MIKFSKMQGLANDFVVINNMQQSISIDKLPIKQLANRYIGVGCDQVLVIEPSNKADFLCRIFNSDGSEAEQCGNGLRCIMRFVHEKELTKKNSASIETKAGIFNAEILPDKLIQVTMGNPCFLPEKIPFLTEVIQPMYELEINSVKPVVKLSILSMGNPHAIMQVTSIEEFPVDDVGYQISNHASFPKSTNVGFMEIVNRQRIFLRTFERGAGETFACGSNACAAVVAGIINNLLDSKVNVGLTFGDLLIEWDGGEKPVIMTGSATNVFEGEFNN